MEHNYFLNFVVYVLLLFGAGYIYVATQVAVTEFNKATKEEYNARKAHFMFTGTVVRGVVCLWIVVFILAIMVIW